MSSRTVVKASNLGKAFQMYDRPQDRLKQFVLPRIRRSLGLIEKQYHRTFTALEDINFEISAGETVGIIGRNGAGKSTLLQILCGTLSPTAGHVEVNGRVAALLELGSGFNSEYTGRENVYLNAKILGLNEDEINARFDTIAAFADIGDHLDQPVRTYSSGMYVRLAFSVIVHVDADILIVDEALAVGDIYFQSKCISHLKSLIEKGITVIFVSHDANTVKSLCKSAIFLKNGKLIQHGGTHEVCEAYYSEGIKAVQSLQAATPGIHLPFKEPGRNELRLAFTQRSHYQRVQNGFAEFLDVYFLGANGRRIESMEFGQEVTLCYEVRSNRPLNSLAAAYHIRTRNGVDLVYSDTEIEGCKIEQLPEGEIIVIKWNFTVHLQSGNYVISAMLSVPEDVAIGKVTVCDFAPLAIAFSVSMVNHLPIFGATYWRNAVSLSRQMK